MLSLFCVFLVTLVSVLHVLFLCLPVCLVSYPYRRFSLFSFISICCVLGVKPVMSMSLCQVCFCLMLSVLLSPVSSVSQLLPLGTVHLLYLVSASSPAHRCVVPSYLPVCSVPSSVSSLITLVFCFDLCQ